LKKLLHSRIIVIFFFFSFCFIELLAADTTYLVISSGSRNGNYYKTDYGISQILNESFPQYQIHPVTSLGSVDNLNRFKEGATDMFIVQRDAAVKAYYTDKSYQKMEIIMPLFPEALQIFIRSEEPGVISFSEFKSKIKNNEIKNFAIGPEGSTTSITTEKVLNLLGIEKPHKDFFITNSPGKYIQEFLDGRIDAIALISSYPMGQFKGTDIDSISIVSCSKSELNLLLNHLKDLDNIPIYLSDSLYPFLLSDDTVNTIGTWSFLAGRSGLIDRISNSNNISAVKTIISQSIRTEGAPLAITYGKNSQYFPYISAEEKAIVDDSDIKLQFFFRGLPISDDLRELLSIRKKSNIISWLIFSTIFFVFLFVLIRYRNRINYGAIWHRYKHWILAIAGLIVIYFLIAELIFFTEQYFYDTYYVRNTFMELSRGELRRWLFFYILADYHEGIYPISLAGKVLVTIAIYSGWSLLGLALLFELWFNINRKKRLSGMKEVNFKEHFVICGWNNRAPKLILDIMEALGKYVQATLNRKKIVVICEEMKEVLSKDNDLKRLLDKGKLVFINGSAKNPGDLVRANIHKAKTVVLLADDNTKEADERVLLYALTIQNYCNEKFHDQEDKIHTIALVNSKELEEYLIKADVNEIVCSADLSNNLIALSTINHGIANIISSAIDYNEDNEFYTIDLRVRKSLIGKTFKQLFDELHKRDILLLGIKSALYEDGVEVVEPEDIEKELDEKTQIILAENPNQNITERLTRQYMINPYGIEKYYKTDEDDQLIVLARNGKDIEKIE